MQIAIVGAGIVGAATAYELAADGHQVTVFEQRGAAAEEASFASAGLLAPALFTPWAQPAIGAGLRRRLQGDEARMRLVGGAGLAGALWAAWERQRRDPWVRLLAQVRQRLARRGIVLAAHLPPRAMAAQLQAQCPPPHPEAEALGAWLLQFERARYAKAGRTADTSLTLLRRQLRRLRWPRRPTPP